MLLSRRSVLVQAMWTGVLLLLSQGNCEEQATRALRALMCSHGSRGGSAQAGCPRNARQTLTNSPVLKMPFLHVCTHVVKKTSISQSIQFIRMAIIAKPHNSTTFHSNAHTKSTTSLPSRHDQSRTPFNLHQVLIIAEPLVLLCNTVEHFIQYIALATL